jgi:type IV pilus assembly protein PilA
MISKKKGFTLIELLVVIAIIGILSSVVLASLNSARNKGADAAIKGNLNGMRAQAELYYDNNSNSYAPTPVTLTTGASCTGAASTSVLGDANIKQAMSAALAQNSGGTLTCVASSTGWAVSMALKTSGAWCVDGSGKATTTTATAAGC